MSRKPVAAYQITFLLAGTLCVASCATRAMSQDQAKEMTNLRIKEFLKARFVDTEKSEAAEGLASFGAKLDVLTGKQSEAQAKATQDARTNVKPDGSVVLDTYYTDVNIDQLVRPSLELQRFCRAQLGTFAVEENMKNEVADAYAARNAADAEWCRQQAESGNVPLGDCATAVDVTHEKQDATQSRWASERGYQDAAGRGAFGLFSCKQPEHAKHPGWTVTIKAVGFESGQSGTLNPHRLTLLISGRDESPTQSAEPAAAPQAAAQTP